LRGLLDNLHGYALGRRVSFADAATLERLFREGKGEGGSLAALIEQIVLSREFHTR
jgi:hypothetical protein